MAIIKVNTQSLAWTDQLRPSQIVGCLLAVSVVFICIRRIRHGFSSPLNKIPGPWYALFTALHLRYYFSTGNIWKYAENMHTKYGSIVRLGPRQVWISDAVAIKQILLTVDLPKVAMYSEISRDKTAPGLFGEM